jgi:CHAD domain-containing protein
MLVAALGRLRDMDVARSQTLPQFAVAYTAGHSGREENWRVMNQILLQATQLERQAVRQALEVPAVGACLLAVTHWLEQLAMPAETVTSDGQADPQASMQNWSRRRIARLHRQLEVALAHLDSPQAEHQARILAKRLRYGIEALRPLLSPRRSKRWYQQAINLQTLIGDKRDVLQASVLLAQLPVHPELAEFLRGVAAGREKPCLATG